MVWYAISDCHPVTASTDQLNRMSAFLKKAAQDKAGLVLVGDAVADLLVWTLQDHFALRHVLHWWEALKDFASYLPVVIVKGNHEDGDGWDEVKRLVRGLNTRFIEEPTGGSIEELPGIRFMHGHAPQFDPTTALWGALISAGNRTLGERLTSRIARWLIWLTIRNGIKTPSQLWDEKDYAAYNSLRAWLDGRYFSYLCVTRHRYLIVGHTHFALGMTNIEGQTYLNCGALGGGSDTGFTYVRIDQGGCSLEQF